MINQATLPNDLKQVISNEQIDFIIKAKRNVPFKKVLSLFFFSFFWLFILSMGLYTSLKSNFKNKSFNLETIITELKRIDYTEGATIMILLFVSIGVIVFLYGIYMLLQKGGYFIATKSGLIKYRNGKIKTTNWEQFSGNTTISNRNFYGDVALELITGKYVSRAKESGHSKRYVPDVIYIVGINNPIAIADKCKHYMNNPELEIKF